MKQRNIFKYKVFILFFVLILIPAVVLSYLGFIVIKKEQEMSELDLKKHCYKINGIVKNYIDDSLKNIIKEIDNNFRNTKGKLSLRDVADIGYEYIKNKKNINGFFILNDNNFIYPLYLNDKQTSVQNEQDELWNMGVSLEYRDKNPEKAIESYFDSLKKADTNQTIIIYGNIARCYFKLKNFDKAKEFYNKIINSKSYDIKVKDIPVYIIAKLQLAEIYNQKLDANTEMQELLNILELIVENKFFISATQLEFYKDIIFSKIIKYSGKTFYKNYMGEIETLKLKSKKQDDSIKFSKEFKENTYPLISQISGTNTFTIKDKYIYKRQIEIENYKLSFILIVISLNDFICEAIKSDLVKLANASNVDIAIIDDKENNLFTTSSIDKQDFISEDNVPETSYKIRVYAKQSVDNKQFIFKRKIIFSGLVVLLVIIIIIGIFGLFRITSREIQLAKMKSDFVASVSHELRSPLTSIKMFGEMFKMGRIKDEKHKEKYYGYISEESERLGKLIDNILDFSKIEEGNKKFKFQLVDIKEITEMIVFKSEFYLKDKEFTIKTNFQNNIHKIIADADAITRVILNLLDNAIKYSNKEKEIKINMEENNGFVIIDVMDKGIGIAKNEQKKIFEKFYRIGDELRRETKGSGLGLAIVKSIVDAHNGKIKVESEINKGSKFSIYLPITQEGEKR